MHRAKRTYKPLALSLFDRVVVLFQSTCCRPWQADPGPVGGQGDLTWDLQSSRGFDLQQLITVTQTVAMRDATKSNLALRCSGVQAFRCPMCIWQGCIAGCSYYVLNAWHVAGARPCHCERC